MDKMPTENVEASSIDQEFIAKGKAFQETAQSYGAMVTELENQLDHAKHMTSIYADAAAAMYGLADAAQSRMMSHKNFLHRDEPDAPIAAPAKKYV